MVRRSVLAWVASMALAVTAFAPPASAVVNGTADTGTPARFPYVGTLVIDTPGGYHYWCSGTMISRDVLLAAGHCFDTDYMGWIFGEGTRIVGVTLNPMVTSDTGFTDDLELWGPIYQAASPDAGVQVPGWPCKHWELDVGAYVLAQDIPDIGPLPAVPDTVGQLDSMALTGHEATIVGYGMTRDRTGGRTGFSDFVDGIRKYASDRITGLTPTTVHLLGDIAAGGTGPCGGDSGAPRLVENADGSQTVVAISHDFGPYCQTPERALRLDTPAIQGFLDSVLDR